MTSLANKQKKSDDRTRLRMVHDTVGIKQLFIK